MRSGLKPAPAIGSGRASAGAPFERGKEEGDHPGGMIMFGKKVVRARPGWLLGTSLGVIAGLLLLASAAYAADEGGLVVSVGVGLHIDDWGFSELWPRSWAEESDTDVGIGSKLAIGTMLTDELELGFSLRESFTSDNDLFELSPTAYLVQHVRVDENAWFYLGPQIGGTYYDFDDLGIDDFGFSAGLLCGLRWAELFVEYNFLWTDVDTSESWRDVEGDLYAHTILVGVRFEF